MQSRLLILVATLVVSAAPVTQAQARDADPLSAIRVSVLKPAALSVSGQSVDLAALGSALRAAGLTRTTLVIVDLDPEARPQFVRSVFAVLRELGHRHVETRTRGFWFVDRLYDQ